MITIKVDPEDLRQIKRKFNLLSTKVQDKVLRDVIAKHALPVKKKMKVEVPVSKAGMTSKRYPKRSHPPGYLKASIGIIRSRRGGKYPTVWIKPRHKGSWDPWYEHFVVGGYWKRDTPDPFVDRTWIATKSGVKSGIKRDTARMIQDRINRL